MYVQIVLVVRQLSSLAAEERVDLVPGLRDNLRRQALASMTGPGMAEIVDAFAAQCNVALAVAGTYGESRSPDRSRRRIMPTSRS